MSGWLVVKHMYLYYFPLSLYSTRVCVRCCCCCCCCCWVLESLVS